MSETSRLILSRKRHQAIIIGNGTHKVKVTIQSVRGGTVDLAIVAPRDTSVDREEIRDRKDHSHFNRNSQHGH